jgi:hypothetical protein
MGPRRFVLLCAVAASLAVPRIAAAASDVFMCVDGIEGGSTDEDFAGCSNSSREFVDEEWKQARPQA